MEEASEILILLPAELMSDFEAIENALGFSEAMAELAEQAGVGEDTVWDSEIAYNSLKFKNRFVKIDHDVANWSDVSSEFVAKGCGVEYYSIHQSDHGLVSLYLLNDSGKRLALKVDIETLNKSTKKKTLSDMDQWNGSISQAAKKSFPKFANISL